MDDIISRKSLKEVYVILNSSDNHIIQKIPDDLKQYIINNMDDNYNFEIDSNKSLNEQKLMDKTKNALANIYKKYLFDNEEEINIKEYKKILEEEKRIKFNPDNIFNKNKEQENIIADNKIAVINEERWYKKLLKFLKEFFKK